MKRLILTATVLGALATGAPAFAGNVAWGVSLGFGGCGIGGAVTVGTPCVAPAPVTCAPVYASAPVVFYRPAVVAVRAPVVYGPVMYGARYYRPVSHPHAMYRGHW